MAIGHNLFTPRSTINLALFQSCFLQLLFQQKSSLCSRTKQDYIYNNENVE